MSPDAVECRDHFCDAISAELGDGRKRAIHAIARATGMSERRIVGIMRGEVKRIWSDELRIVREWHSIWIERRHAQMSHELALLEARRSARKVA